MKLSVCARTVLESRLRADLTEEVRHNMLEFIGRRATQGVLAVVAACVICTASQAATINIILSDMQVSYLGNSDGGVLFDSMGGTTGGNLNPALADSIATAVFNLDSATVDVLMDPPTEISADLRLINVGPTLTKGLTPSHVGNNGGGFGFDLFTDDGALLRLGMTSVDLLVTDTVFFFTGQATLLDQQNLPGGLAFDATQPVVFSYTATLPAVQGGGTTNAIMANGAFTISGIAIPEPGAMLLLCTALVVAGFATFRRTPRMAHAVVRG